MEIVATLGISILMGLLIDRLRSHSRTVGIAAVALGCIAVGDVVRAAPPPATDFGKPDPIADELRQLGPGAVAEYPLFGFDNFNIATYLIRQLRHNRPLFNGSLVGTLNEDLAAAANTADSPQAATGLWLGGVRDIVVTTGSPGPVGPAFHLRERLSGASIYSLGVPPTAGIAVLHGTDALAVPTRSAGLALDGTSELRLITRCRTWAKVRFGTVTAPAAQRLRIGGTNFQVTPRPTGLVIRLPLAGRITVVPIQSIGPHAVQISPPLLTACR